ncbi:hypothetical protein BCR42DRAFT_416898 [Absidia repens]|uniref:Uncharacterized protein n=1 Tax=Absidia repens TaxID=90262 RepID=A0A1X2IF52_9FUNG|nr:hypothetical protein BCR42DRAFT_416898 [Absidia repens]
MIFRHPISTLTRFTSSTLKYASSNTANLLFASSSTIPSLSASPSDDYPDSQQIIEWMNDAQQGMDAFFDDHYDMAYTIFAQHAAVSPFHALGYALMAYVEAMVSFEGSHIRTAQERLAAAESLCHQFVKRTRQRFPASHHRHNYHRHQTKKSPSPSPPSSRSPAGLAATATAYAMDWYSKSSSSSSSPSSSLSASSSSSSSSSYSSTTSTDTSASQIRFNGLSDSTTFSSSSCFSSSSTVNDSHLSSPPLPDTKCSTNPPTAPSNNDSLITELPPAMQYEVLETNCMLMSATLQFLSNHWMDYMRAAYKLRKTYKKYEQLFEVVTGKKPYDYAYHVKQCRKRKRSFRRRKQQHGNTKTSNNNSNRSNSNSSNNSNNSKNGEAASVVQSGVFFGVGLLSLIFSLLPPKLNKLLNTLGFHSSRPFALQLLQQSYSNQDGMYSSLSALALLAYYTNLSSFIHPKLLPSSLTPSKAREIVNAIKLKYPHGKIWKLLEGKLYRMEGCLGKSVEALRDCRRRDSVCMPTSLLLDHKRTSTTGQSLLTTMTTSFPPQHPTAVSELALQVSALSVYEMGWGQIFLGDYFQASETFFRLESMNNWSRAFYHYIATCCLYGDEEYDKAAIDFVQIPRLLARRRKSGTRLLANEQFAERTILQWMQLGAQQVADSNNGTTTPNDTHNDGDDWRQRKGVMDGHLLQQVVLVNPLWELIYLWNGIYYVSPTMLQQMKHGLQENIDRINNNQQNGNSGNPTITTTPCSELSRLQLLLGVVERELGNDVHAETCFRRVIAQEKTCLLEHQHSDPSMDASSNNETNGDALTSAVSWAGSYALYEMALLKSLPLCDSPSLPSSAEHPSSSSSLNTSQTAKIKEAREWLRKVDEFHNLYHANNSNNSGKTGSNGNGSGSSSINYTDVSCESACMLLHIRCQLLYEKMDELLDS